MSCYKGRQRQRPACLSPRHSIPLLFSFFRHLLCTITRFLRKRARPSFLFRSLSAMLRQFAAPASALSYLSFFRSRRCRRLSKAVRQARSASAVAIISIIIYRRKGGADFGVMTRFTPPITICVRYRIGSASLPYRQCNVTVLAVHSHLRWLYSQ